MRWTTSLTLYSPTMKTTTTDWGENFFSVRTHLTEYAMRKYY